MIWHNSSNGSGGEADNCENFMPHHRYFFRLAFSLLWCSRAFLFLFSWAKLLLYCRHDSTATSKCFVRFHICDNAIDLLSLQISCVAPNIIFRRLTLVVHSFVSVASCSHAMLTGLPSLIHFFFLWIGNGQIYPWRASGRTWASSTVRVAHDPAVNELM